MGITTPIGVPTTQGAVVAVLLLDVLSSFMCLVMFIFTEYANGMRMDQSDDLMIPWHVSRFLV